MRKVKTPEQKFKNGLNHSTQGALVPVSVDENLPANVTEQEFQQMMKEEIDQSLSSGLSLPLIKIVHAGSIFKFPPDAEGNEKKEESFSGIIFDYQYVNAYWPADGGGSINTIPACSSLDALRGSKEAELVEWNGREVSVFGKCTTCLYNQFGTATDESGNPDKGKACKNGVRLHIVLDDHLLPVRLTLPPSSLGIWRNYLSRLVDMNKNRKGLLVMPISVKTEFSLEEAQHPKGFVYSKILLKQIEQIPIDEFIKLKKMKEQMAPMIRGQQIQAEEYASEPEGDVGFNPS